MFITLTTDSVKLNMTEVLVATPTKQYTVLVRFKSKVSASEETIIWIRTPPTSRDATPTKQSEMELKTYNTE